MDVLEHERGGHLIGQTFVEPPPCGEQVLAVTGRTRLEPEQAHQSRLDPPPLLGVGDRMLDGRPQLRQRRRRVLTLDDRGVRPDHLGERPERDAFPVRQASAAMPSRVDREPVDVLLELPHQARLPETGAADHGQQLRLAALPARVEQILQHPQLAITPEERRLERGRTSRPSDPRDDPGRPPQGDRLGLALQLVRPRLLVDDRRVARATGGLAHVHRAGRCRRLDPRRRIDEVPGDHPLPDRGQVDGRLPGQHAGTRRELWSAHLVAEGRDRVHQFECRADGTLGVVLHRGGRAPHGHHGITDELLHHAAVACDHRPRRFEVAGEEIADLFGVARLRERGESHQIGEQDRDQAPLRQGSVRCRRGSNGDLPAERDAAFTAELRPWRVRRATRRAPERQVSAAFTAELATRFVLRTARRAAHAFLPEATCDGREATAPSASILGHHGYRGAREVDPGRERRRRAG